MVAENKNLGSEKPVDHVEERIRSVIENISDSDLTLSSREEVVTHLESELAKVGYNQDEYDVCPIADLIARLHEVNDTQDSVGFAVKSHGRLIAHFNLEAEQTGTREDN